MKIRDKILIAILTLFPIIIIIASISLYIQRLHSHEETIVMGTIKADSEFISENPALYQNTIASEDWDLNDYPYRVCIMNYSDLFSLGIDNFAIDTLEPFLDLYINLYEPSGRKYQGEVLIESFIENEAIPQFTVSIHQENGQELLVKCSYWTQAQLYEFSSILSE